MEEHIKEKEEYENSEFIRLIRRVAEDEED